MTGIEIVLFLAGCVFMVGSFFITEKLSPSELSKIAELSEDELKNIIDRGLDNAEGRIENAIEEHICASSDKVDRALEKETNEKIMAISEYSDTVLENINKAHNEIMFLYSMLNDKHTELTGMASDLQRLAADVRNLQENVRIPEESVVSEIPVQKPERKIPQADTFAEEVLQEPTQPATQARTAKESPREEILSLYREGLSEIEIARKLKMGVGEVRLVIGLYRGE